VEVLKEFEAVSFAGAALPVSQACGLGAGRRARTVERLGNLMASWRPLGLESRPRRAD
jgi:hypothetical protein